MLYTIAMFSAGAPTLAATPPTFAKDFYVGMQTSLAINQGGYSGPSGTCCSLTHASQCKVQAINMGEDSREQGSMNRSRSDGGQGSIVNWWGEVKKQMAIVPGSSVNSTHKYACAQYCPLDGEFMSAIMIGDGQKGYFDKPKDKGKASITQPKSIGGITKECEHWKWTETIFRVIPMQETDFYVDNGAAAGPAPFFTSTTIKPFNKPIGVENASFVGYKAMDVSDYFDIDPDSVKNCQMSSQCQQNNAAELRNISLTAAAAFRFAPSMYEKAKTLANAVLEAHSLTAAAPSPPAPNVSFGTDWTAHENGLLMIAQGASFGAGGDPCCAENSPNPQCQVQLQHFEGQRYYDLTNQRSRFEDSVIMQVTVDDYTSLKSMLINTTNGVDTCQEYCPIDPDDKLEAFDPFDPFDTVKDLGKTTFEGKAAEHYQWSDKIFKIIKMQTTDFYADISNPKAAVPLFSTTVLTPFGQAPMGRQNETWTNFTHAAPPAAKFKIAGVATCPQSGQCGQQSKQTHRLHMRQFHTFARHHVDGLF